MCHGWTHYAFVVPFVWALNRNSKHTTYAAAWTLVNAHEVAAISGKVSLFYGLWRALTDPQAAAYKLGADYPTELYENDFARLCMNLYLALAHGKWLSKKRTSHF